MKHLYFKTLLTAIMLMSLSAAAETASVDPCATDNIIMMPEQPDAAAAMTARLAQEMPTTDLYEPHHGMDFTFLKNRTNPNVKPYTFMQDQTWVGIPVFVAGMIAKGEKEAFRQNYKNSNTRIRLIKYNFHSK